MLGYNTWLDRADSLHDVARLRLFQGTCSLLSLVGNASNFGLYCLGGSRFRRALCDVVHDWTRRISTWWSALCSVLSGAAVHSETSTARQRTYAADIKLT